MRIAITILALTVAVPAAAQEASISRRGARVDGKNELSAHIGGQASLGGTTPAGLRVQIDYSRRLTDLVWFNVKLNPTFGIGANRPICTNRFGQPYECGGSDSGFYAAGHAIEALAGIKLKFAVPRLPSLMPYGNLNVGVVGMFSRPTRDDGAGLAFNFGGGLKYFVHKNVAVGGELTFTLGPAWYSETCSGCDNGRAEFYRALSFAAGAEFNL